MSQELSSNGLPRLWSWTCPVCGIRIKSDMHTLSVFRLDHLRSCVPLEIDESVGVLKSRKRRRRDYDR